MISQERSGALKSFLGSLPEQIAARLARAVEVDRLIDGKSLPHELILESLRPSLRRLGGSHRTPTALRFFCLPFEDLFSVVPRRALKGSVAPIWTWLGQTLLPRETKNYCRNFKSALVAGNHRDTRAHAEAFWPIAAEAMGAALVDGRKTARAALGGDCVLADAEEAALLLGVGAEVMEIQATLIRPVAVLNDELLTSLRAIHDGLLQVAPAAAPYVAVIAMNRLARPWEALRLPLSVSPHDGSIRATDLGLAGEIIFADVASCANAVRAAKQPSFDVDALIENVSRFTTLSRGVHKLIAQRGGWAEDLAQERAALGEVMDAFMARAPSELLGALKDAATSGCLPDREKVERARGYARLVMGCKPFAAAGAFGASLKLAEQEMRTNLRQHSDDVVKQLRGADAKCAAPLENQFDIDVKLTAVLVGEEEAEFLRRRGRAALGAGHRA